MIERFERQGIQIVAFPASWLSLHATSLGQSGRPDRVKPVRANEALSQTGAEAALDGPMYGDCPGSCRDLRFLHFERGYLDIASEEPDAGITVSVDDAGNASWRRGGRLPAGARVAVQLYPSLVEEGRSVASGSPNTEYVWRAALGQLDDGRLAFAIWRGPMPEFAGRLIAAGFRWAGYTDGGGSTSMAVQGQRLGSAEDRAVGSFLLAKSPTGPSHAWAYVLAGLAAAGLLGLGIWLFVRSRKSSA